ncbi:hypothetical protein EVAR_29638_1 [Eumeta japonica]|uniref:Uncharacterized protein n=1 Tax=Eumeta variegata TaxID=151549 RepID=A0A4C1W6N5_EUMVA|nr:hypothetical protein EVAR_29638_1 [Eumeta japonica]
MGVAVDGLRKVRNQKILVSCSSAEDAKKIDERLKMARVDLKIPKPGKRLPTVIQNVFSIKTRQVKKQGKSSDSALAAGQKELTGISSRRFTISTPPPSRCLQPARLCHIIILYIVNSIP